MLLHSGHIAVTWHGCKITVSMADTTDDDVVLAALVDGDDGGDRDKKGNSKNDNSNDAITL